MLPPPSDYVEVGGAVFSIYGLTRLSADNKPILDQLGTTEFTVGDRGVAAVFGLENFPPAGAITVAGVWVAREGDKFTPLLDPTVRELNLVDIGEPIYFGVTFRAGLQRGDYSFGLFTVQNGRIDQLIRRIDFTAR